MKKVNRIVANDGTRKVEIIIKQEAGANFDRDTVLRHMDDVVDRLVEVIGERYHYKDIKLK
jgi:hypothetical protein